MLHFDPFLAEGIESYRRALVSRNRVMPMLTAVRGSPHLGEAIFLDA